MDFNIIYCKEDFITMSFLKSLFGIDVLESRIEALELKYDRLLDEQAEALNFILIDNMKSSKKKEKEDND